MYYKLVDGEGGQEYRPVEEDLIPASEVARLREELQQAVESYKELARSGVPLALADLISGQSLEEVRLSAERVKQAYRALQRQTMSTAHPWRPPNDLSPVARIAAGLKGSFGLR